MRDHCEHSPCSLYTPTCFDGQVLLLSLLLSCGPGSTSSIHPLVTPHGKINNTLQDWRWPHTRKFFSKEFFLQELSAAVAPPTWIHCRECEIRRTVGPKGVFFVGVRQTSIHYRSLWPANRSLLSVFTTRMCKTASAMGLPKSKWVCQNLVSAGPVVWHIKKSFRILWHCCAIFSTDTPSA